MVIDTTGAGCVLRVSGEFEVDALLSRITIVPYRIDRKGQPRVGPKSTVSAYDSFHVATSDAGWCDLERQIGDTIEFLRNHRQDVAYVMSFPGVSEAELDFAVARRDVAVQNDYFPAELLRLAGDLGIGINISHYSLLQSAGDE